MTANDTDRTGAEGPWRVGRRVPVHVYAGDTPLFTAPSEEIAARVVADHNAALASAPASEPKAWLVIDRETGEPIHACYTAQVRDDTVALFGPEKCEVLPLGVISSTPASEPVADEIITILYRRFKEWSRRGFGPDDVTWCEVKADVQTLLASAVDQATNGAWEAAISAIEVLACQWGADARTAEKDAAITEAGRQLVEALKEDGPTEYLTLRWKGAQHALEAERKAATERTRAEAAERQVEALRAALKTAEQFIANGMELGFIHMPDEDTEDAAHATLPTIRATLAASMRGGNDGH